jgi:DNA modification methylase
MAVKNGRTAADGATLNVEWVPLGKVKPYAGNPRKRSDHSIKKIADSIREFGWQQPLVVDKDYVIIVGHGRFDGARLLRKEQVPVVVAAHLSPEQVAAYRIADNRTADETEWDPALLGIELRLLDEQQYDLSHTGFTDDELKELLQSVKVDDGNDDEDVPELEKDAVTQAGDLWIMGNHRLLCGDSTRLPDVERLMDGTKAHLLWTDPPYNVDYEGKTKDALTIKNDAMTPTEFRQFLRNAFAAAFAVTIPGGSFYIAHADTEGYNFRGALADAGWTLRQCLVWVKNAIVMGRQDYHWRHEPILYGWKPGGSHSWYADRAQDTVLEFDRPSRSAVHPTMKPVALVKYCMINSSKPGDNVLDLFGGAGATLIASEKVGRYARLMELDPNYCDVIVRRWQKFTGKQATLGEGGETFAARSRRGGPATEAELEAIAETVARSGPMGGEVLSIQAGSTTMKRTAEAKE